MNLALAADAAALIGIVIATWSGWRTGAARMIVSTLAGIIGIFLAAQGRGPLAGVVSQVLPEADEVLVSLLVLAVGSWILLGLFSWVLGNLMRGVLRTLRLGLLDDALGAALGLLQGLLICSVIFFLLNALAGVDGLPEPIAQIASAAERSQAAELVRDAIYPLLWSLLGSGLPVELQQILRP